MRKFDEIPPSSDPDAPVYSIGTVARLLGISVFTLRMYEREGLVISQKSDSNQRRYSASDIERLKCIRQAITEKKFGIAAIKTIYSLIPCWSIVRCSEEDRKNCQASANHSKPCWSFRHEDNACNTRNCRSCPVYRDHSDCGKVKQSIMDLTQKW